ncbi:acetyl-CoA carboxylase [Paraphysoderma sedebokerense]|nr:acetyl-CoA carboxylase [Paraphysoderma sedebokerense]
MPAPTNYKGSFEHSRPSRVKDFVISCLGHTVIEKVLIANNGIAAVKEIRSVRKWAYETFGDERAIKFVVMATPEDLQHNAEYIRMSDHYIEVPGGSNNNNYANVDLIVDIASRTGVHAVWAGWGHASENPKLPDKLKTIGVVFIGPSGGAMRSLGDKISSTIVAQSANVPTMAWSGSGLTTDARTAEGYITVPDDLYMQACVDDLNQALEGLSKVNFPCMIKASEGGGGKGIRKVLNIDDFAAAFRAVQSEVPGSPIFLMSLATNARHLEVQLLADSYGNAISLFGRDCSVQRRHQKIIEEAPVTVANSKMWEEMEKSAVRLAQLVGYENAGTVEFLYDIETSQYYFLELNPRLQVEHPTTEMVSGVNIPAAQLQVAMGIPLHNIRDIRVLYGLQPSTSTPIDFQFQNPQSHTTLRKPFPLGHVIACRITAENPDAGFKPSSGSIKELNFRSNTNVWGYFSVSADGGLHEYADSQFGHIFAYGHDRSQSRKNMIMALKELSIRGDFRTTVEYLIKLLETDEFSENRFNTAWLDALIKEENVKAERPDLWVTVFSGAVWKASESFRELTEGYKRSLEKGQVLPTSTLKTDFHFDIIYENTKYSLNVSLSSPHSYCLTLSDSSSCSNVMLTSKPMSDGSLLVQFDGESYVVYLKEEVNGDRITINGKTAILERENDPTKMRSPSPGKLVRWCVDDGGRIVKGQVVAEIEVMKMYMPLTASEDGVLHTVKQAGSSIEAGDLLATVSLDDPSSIRQADMYRGELPLFGPPTSPFDKPHQKFAELLNSIQLVLDGYDVPDSDSKLKALLALLKDPELPYAETWNVLSALSGRIPGKLESDMSSLLSRSYNSKASFPAVQLLEIVDSAGTSFAASNPAFWTTVAPLLNVFDRYKASLRGHAIAVLVSLLNKYSTTESHFIGDSPMPTKEEDCIISLRDQYKDELDQLVTIVLSHSKIIKNKLVLQLLAAIEADEEYHDGNLTEELKTLAGLSSVLTAKVALRAREFLIQLQLPSLNDRQKSMEEILISSVTNEPVSAAESFKNVPGVFHLPIAEKLKELVTIHYSLFDLLPMFFYHENPYIVLASLETYARRAYNAYQILMVKHHLKSIDQYPVISSHQHRRFQSFSSDDSSDTGLTDNKMFPFIEWHFTYPDYPTGSPMLYTLPFSPTTPDTITESDRILSVSDMSLMGKRGESEPVRVGVMAAFSSLEDLEKSMSVLLQNFRKHQSQLDVSAQEGTELVNVLAISLSLSDSDSTLDNSISSTLSTFISAYGDRLREKGVRRVTFILYKQGQYPRYFTFREQYGFSEDPTIRNIEPSHAFQLELQRLSNFTITPLFTSNRNIHLYYAVGKENTSDCRFFVRAITRPRALRSNTGMVEYLASEGERILSDILDSLEIVSANHPNTDCNHLFINFISHFNVSASVAERTFKECIQNHGKRLWKLRVQTAEIRFLIEASDASKSDDTSRSGLKVKTTALTPYRFVFSNISGVLKSETYKEVRGENGRIVWYSLKGNGDLHLMETDKPYPTKEMVQPKRYKAHLMGTTYVYDYVELFREAIEMHWLNWLGKHLDIEKPEVVLDAKELDFGDNGELQHVNRPAGTNRCGMVAWLFEMFTPEYPTGRKAIVIANDITFQIGSFGPEEDYLFYKASSLARQLGLPRIYISANSGARIGLAEEVRQLYKVCWNDASDYTKGFKYLYLTPADFERLNAGVTKSVNVEEVIEDGERRMKIVDVIGAKDGLGVENLRGSGLIAGETSRAYEDIFTITLVSCRSVGIGAYLVRLGQRTIQTEGQPIILTGAAALNKVLGREVYTSNLQLGGTQIMHKNGVSHLVAADNLQGVFGIVNWLSYIPKHRGAELPILYTPKWDPIDRDIDFIPTKTQYDPRHMLAGYTDESGRWISGFFDRDSFTETLSDWAKTVVVGRARLGGIPMGVIAVETRTMETVISADPANPNSEEQVQMEAAGVWVPSSSFKTAQAINDFNKGEQLPLIIFANWRGFSGGQKDMYDAILKYGSYIVDALRSYKQPVFVYLVPNGELRGGAWVVLDPTINPEMMEMYADRQARGGVLEPEGIVEIKYRRPQLLSTMERIDPVYRKLKAIISDGNISHEEKSKLKMQLENREMELLPIFHQVALQFADLHDTAGRMLAKNVIQDILDWTSSRRYFYWRVRRRVLEESVLSKIQSVNEKSSREERLNLLKKWFETDNPSLTYHNSTSSSYSSPSSSSISKSHETLNSSSSSLSSAMTLTTEECTDEQVVHWIENSSNKIQEKIDQLQIDYLSEYISKMIKDKPNAAVNGLLSLFTGFVKN